MKYKHRRELSQLLNKNPETLTYDTARRLEVLLHCRLAEVKLKAEAIRDASMLDSLRRITQGANYAGQS